MSLSLQQYIMALLSGPSSSLGFLDISVRSDFSGATTSIDYGLVYTLAYIFISADMLLYAGVIVVIFALGFYYRASSIVYLSTLLLYISSAFIYLSILTNIVGLIIGFDFLSSFSVLIFEGSYTFNMFSQIIKVMMLLVLGGLYVLFPAIVNSKIRILELPVLLHISVALCSTIISSTNFALLLLALEGFSLTLYIMTALGRSYGGVTASVKYFAFGTLGSVFLF